MPGKQFYRDNFPALREAMTFNPIGDLKRFWREMRDKMVEVCGDAGLNSIYLYYGVSKDIVQNVPGKILFYKDSWFVLCHKPLDAETVVATGLKSIRSTGARESLVLEVSNALWGDRGAVFEADDGQGTVIFPSTSRHGEFQISNFDRFGFFGHTFQDSLEAAIRYVLICGYRLTDRDLVSEYGRTKEFAEGNLKTYVIKAHSRLEDLGARKAAQELLKICEFDVEAAYAKAKDILRKDKTAACEICIGA